MKRLLKWVGLVCLSCTALQAGSFLVLIRGDSSYNTNYYRAEQWGGRYVVADTPNYGSPELAFIIEDVWWGTPWLEAKDPFWIRSEMNNLYWSAWNYKVQVNKAYPGAGGYEAFNFWFRMEYEGFNYIQVNTVIWGTKNYTYIANSSYYGYALYFSTGGANTTSNLRTSILAVY